MGRASRDKGARGERELAAALTAEGFDAHRGRQYHGGPDSPDVVCHSLPISWESKYGARLNLWPAMTQAVDEAKEGEFPVVAFKHVSNNRERLRDENGHFIKDEREWLTVLRLSDLLAILRESEYVK